MDSDERSVPRVSVETWVVIVGGTAYLFGITSFLSVSLALALPSRYQLSAITLAGMFALSIGFVYSIRISRFFRPVVRTLWQGVSLHTSGLVRPPGGLCRDIKTELRSNLKSEGRFVTLPFEKLLAFLYFLLTALTAIVLQIILLSILSNPNDLETATTTLIDGNGFNLILAGVSLLQPLLGVGILLLSLLGSSGEDSVILTLIIGIPAAVTTPGMWNIISLVEQLQHRIVRWAAKKMKFDPVFQTLLIDFFTETDEEKVFKMARPLALLLYLAVLVVSALLALSIFSLIYYTNL